MTIVGYIERLTATDFVGRLLLDQGEAELYVWADDPTGLGPLPTYKVMCEGVRLGWGWTEAEDAKPARVILWLEHPRMVAPLRLDVRHVVNMRLNTVWRLIASP